MTKAKKTLALVMAVVMCFTMMIGCLTISADNPGLIAVGTTTIDEGTASAVVSVNITGAAFAAGQITLSYNTALGTPAVASSSQYLTTNTATAGKVYLIIESGASSVENISAGAFTLTFSNLASLAAGDYDITVDAVDFANYDENAVEFNTTNGKVTVQAVAQHTHTYQGVVTKQPTYSETGIMTYTCSGCGDSYTEDIPVLVCEHNYQGVVTKQPTYSETGIMTYTCSQCGDSYTEDIPVLVCEHSNLTLVSATSAIENGASGVINYVCDTCGETVQRAVSYVKASSLTSAPDIGCDSTTLLGLKASKSNFDSNATDGFVVVTHHYGNGDDDTMEVFTMADAKVSGNYYKWDVPVWYTQFSDTFECTFYTLRAGQWTSGIVRSYSIKDAAMTVVTGSYAEGVKKAAANLLEAGAQAQLYFHQDTDNLANAGLTGSYADLVVTTTNTPVRTNGENFDIRPADFKTAGKAIFATPSVVLQDAVAIQQKINFNYYTGETPVSEMEDLHIRYTYTDVKGNTVNGVCSDYTVASTRNFVIGVTAPNMRQVVTFTVYNGDTAISAPAIYSVEAVMAAALAGNSGYAPVISAILNYSDVVAMYL